jgi:hypothetical protein
MNSLFCKDTVTVSHTGVGTGGAHLSVISMMPGRYAITGGGTLSGATTTAKLIDQAGNTFDLLDPSGAVPTFPETTPVVFFTPGCSLRIATAAAGAGTALTFTLGKID